MNIIISDIKPIGNFEDTLKSLREKADTIIGLCNEKKEYNSSISNLITFLVVVIEALEEGISKKDIWNKEEALIDLLYTHLIVIDLNQTAHKYLNPTIKFDSPVKQLNDALPAMIHSGKKFYSDIKITE